MTSPMDVTQDPNATYAQIISQTLANWGLSSLTDLVSQLGMSGAGNDQIDLAIQNSPEYQARFAGNAARAAKGMGVLSPAQYIAMEGSYRQALAGLPQGFYDSKESFDNWIGGDVSASELSQRVQDANTAYVTADQSSRDAWDAYYPHAGAGGAVASILDTSVAEPLIQQQVTAAGIGAAALRQGLSLTNQATATAAAQNGVTIDSARNAYSAIAQRMSTDTSAGARFGMQFGQQQEENATLLGDAGANQQQALLYSEEQAQFGGKGGGGDTSGDPGSNF